MNVNQATVVGRVTRDPEIRTTQSGQAVTSFSLATNDYWTDKSGQKQEKTEFHNIVLWGRLAEIAGQYMVKGQEVYINGKMQTREYEGKDGIMRKTTEIVGSNLQLGQRPGGGRSDDEASRANGSAGFTNKKNYKKEDSTVPTIDLDAEQDEIRVEDIPF
jgi:single-strand DNA-binding protein